MDPVIYQGSEFSSFIDFRDAVQNYGIRMGVTYVTSNSSGHGEVEVEALKCSSVSFKCERGGIFKPRGTGKRQTK